MNEIRTEIKLFDYLKNYHQKVNTITKILDKTTDNNIISSSHSPLEIILIEHKGSVMKVTPFKLSNTEIKQFIE